MRIIFSLFSLLFLLSCNSKSGTDQKGNAALFNEEAEKAAIFKVIENETKCFFDGNYECWKTNWVHETYALQAWNNNDGTFDAASGWDSINVQGKRWIEQYYQNGKKIIHPEVHRENIRVKFFTDKLAWLSWTQYNKNSATNDYSVSFDTRLMEKDSSGWKIAQVSSLWDSKNKVPADRFQ